MLGKRGDSMFVRNCWYATAWDFEVSDKEILARTIAGEDVVLYRKTDGGVVAFEDRCCHRHAPLSEGRIVGDDLRCMYHGLKFAPDGRCNEIPGQPTIPERARVRRFPAVECHSLIWVWLGEPERANPDKIPNAIALDHPDWLLKPGYVRYEADPLLVIDNALDFSHITYVHEQTFGGTDKWALERPKIERIEGGVRVSRWLMDVAPPPYLQRFKNHNGNIDRWSTYDFVLPGVLLLRSDMYPTGSDLKDDRNIIFSYFASNALMAESDEATHSFFRWGPRSGENPSIVDILMEAGKVGFAEDKRIIEAQQRVVRRNPNKKMLTIAADVGLVMMRRVIDEALAAEAASAPAVN
jgi:phenylpropionate dioxygenase-like ring-hydroxylating dioxygenase large terminal subunit